MPPPLPVLPNVAKENGAAVTEPVATTPTQAAENTKHYGYRLAKRGERMIGWLIEGVLVAGICVLIWGDEYLQLTITDWYILVNNVPVWVLLGVESYPIWGCNVGHRIMGLQVINAKNGEVERNAVNDAMRALLKNILGILMVPVMWLLWDADRQNVYDKLMNHYVVKKNKK